MGELGWAGVFTSCTDSDDVGDSYRTFEGTTVKDYLDQNPEYSMFETALERVGSLSLMSSYGKYTCFLPNNEAVNTYLEAHGYASFDALLDTLPALRQMVYYHIIDGEANGVEQNPIRSSSWMSGRETEDDYYGYDNDKDMHNRGFMKAPDSYCSSELANGDTSPIHAGTARNDAYNYRRVLKLVSWPTTRKHTLRISNLEDKPFDIDYIEFIPTDLIEGEDTH